MSEFRKCVNLFYAEMRPYIPGEDLTGVFISETEVPGLGGMVARNPENNEDQWYVAKEVFEGKFMFVGDKL